MFGLKKAIRKCPHCKQHEADILKIKEMNTSLDNGTFKANVAFTGDIVRIFAASFIDWFEDTGGENFVTLDLNDPRDGINYTITMQKKFGSSPADKIAALEEKIRQLVNV